MTSNSLSASTALGPHLAGVMPSSAPGGAVYDTLGMPMSLLAAKAMTKSAVQAALGRTLAKLHHESVSAIDAKALIDSIEVVFLVGRFYRELGRNQLDLSKVDRDRWSSLEGVADVLHHAMGELT
ncbi:hypothetical protein [Kocuria rosea]|uniref:hypothetical protein n=1 Tax=Kocuria rosea TaxID=1275 RepID=UPI00203C2267|nr:hypothetical protein [Kocuria rosea]